MFKKLGNVVAQHYVKIIIAWIVILCCAIPVIPHIGDVVVYQDSEMLSEDAPSFKGQEVVDEYFSTSKSSVIVVLQDEDLTGPQVRDFVLQLEENLNDSVENGDLKYVQSIMTIYSLYEETIYGFSQMAGGTVMETVPSVNGTAGIIYGIPILHLGIWQNFIANASINETTADAMAGQATMDYLYQQTQGQDQRMANISFLYAGEYIEAWGDNSDENSQVRMSLAKEEAVNQTLLQISSSPEMSMMFSSVSRQLSFESWNDSSSQADVAISIVAMGFSSSMNAEYAEMLSFVEGSYHALMTGTSSEFSRSVIENGTIDTYPQLLPQDIVHSFLSPDNSTMIVMLSFSKSSGYAEDGNGKPILDNVEEIRSAVSHAKKDTGVKVSTYVTGDPALEVDMEESMMEDIERIDPIAVILVIIILGVFYRSVVTPLTPLSIIGLAFVGTLGILYLVGRYVVDIHYTTMTMLLVVMMAVGVDYGIFMITRYREERMKGVAKTESVKTAIIWAGESITTSGISVIIAFGVLSLGKFGMMKSMGIVIGMGILMTLLMALTLLPSLIMLIGDKVFWPSKIDAKKLSTRYTGFFRWAAKFAIKHSKAILVAALVISIPTTIVVFTVDTSYDFINSMPDTESKDGLDAMADGFGAGEVMKTSIVIEFNEHVLNGSGGYDLMLLDQLESICQEISVLSNVKKVTTITRPYGETIPYGNLSSLGPMEQAQYLSAMAQSVGSDPHFVMAYVTLEENPFTRNSFETIDKIESLLNGHADDEMVEEHYLAGATISMRDVSEVMNADFSVMRVVVLIGEYIALLVILGSVILPIRSILTILLSISWTLAVVILLFQFGLGMPVVYMLPLMLFILLLGLGLDYDIFVVTRIREEVKKGKSTDDAIVKAVERTGGIITVCGLIMGGSLGTLMLSSSSMMQQFGFGLLFAIFLDAMVVRIFLVPAIMSMLGKWNWWAPSWMKWRK